MKPVESLSSHRAGQTQTKVQRHRSLAVSPLRGNTSRQPHQQIQLHHHHHHQHQQQQTDRSMECGGDRHHRGTGAVSQPRQQQENKQQRGDAVHADESTGAKPVCSAHTAAAGDSVGPLHQPPVQQSSGYDKPVKSVIYLALSDDFASSSSVTEHDRPEPQPQQRVDTSAESPSTMTIESADDVCDTIGSPTAAATAATGPAARHHYCISSQTTIAIRLAATSQSADTDSEIAQPAEKAANAMVPQLVLSRATYVAPSGAAAAAAPTTPTKSTAATPAAPANRCIRFNLASATWAPVCQLQQPLTCTEERSYPSKHPTVSSLEKKKQAKSVHHQHLCPSVFHRGKSPSHTVVSRPAVPVGKGRTVAAVRQAAQPHRNQQSQADNSPTAAAYLPRDSFAERCRPPSSWCQLTSSVARRCVEFSPRCLHTAAALPMPLIGSQQAFLKFPRVPVAAAAAASIFHLRDFTLYRVRIDLPATSRSCIIQLLSYGEYADVQNCNGPYWHQNSTSSRWGSNLQWQLLQTRANLVLHQPLSVRSTVADGSTGSTMLQLFYHRSDCYLLERLSLTARLFPDTCTDEEMSATNSASSTALLTHIEYPVELHLHAPALEESPAASERSDSSSPRREFCISRRRLLNQAAWSNVSNATSPVGSVQVASSKHPCRSQIVFQPTTSSSTESACSSSISEICTSSDDDSDVESEIGSIYSWSCSTSEF